MFRIRQLVKAFTKLFKQISKQFLSAINKQLIWLLRTTFGINRRRGSANAGFVLPTVAMVSIVVILLTTVILFRSFERSKNASNVRVNEVVMQAASPALTRAKAKISALFSDPTLPRSVPSNITLYNTLLSKSNVYTLGDETPIILGYDLDNSKVLEDSNTIPLENREKLQTAWKFPFDTNNNGKFDSFILYGLYFRNAPGTNPTRKRSPLDARTPPMLPARAGGACDAAGDTSASLVGSSGWYKLPSGELKKSFFVYAATVPISDLNSLDKSKYEKYQGNKGFSALEMQQDRSQIPITNNAVVYEDDLDITPGPRFRLNGRIITNSNLLTGKGFQDITLFQVSSPESCYYERENGKILVGGNVAGNNAISDSDAGGTQIHLYKENAAPDTSKALDGANKSTTNKPNEIVYNSQAYAERIDLLVNAQFANNSTTDPKEVNDKITTRISNDPNLDLNKVRQEELENYFRKRTRRVPFKEINYGSSAVGAYTKSTVLQGYDSSARSNKLRPPDEWMYPLDANTKLVLNTSQLPAGDPDTVDQTPVIESQLGDRILVGNNLPQFRWDNTKQEFVGEDEPDPVGAGVTWIGSSKARERFTQVRQLADLGVTGRDGFWENSAATPRANELDIVGGLRVITGAGIYSPSQTRSKLPAPPAAADDTSTTSINESLLTSVWPDTMPMLVPADPTITGSSETPGHLVMRATAVYHHNKDSYAPLIATPDYYQTPIACVSSYYDSTDKETATNPSTLTNVSGFLVPEALPAASPRAKSNNGISYAASTTTAASITRGQTVDSNGLFTTTATADNVTDSSIDLLERLKYQANLVFPNGRLVNPLLRQALQKATTKNLTLSEQSALDSTICAIQIADGTLARDATLIPDGAIKETSFLDARQIKVIDKDDNPATPEYDLTGKYDLEIEQRQPLEIRATVIDLDQLRTTSITGTWSNEYLLPNSGIIYASRDDAQPDRSNPNSTNISASDYRLDPNRRPNAIMLINGSKLSRQNTYRPEEKGLILATDLPVYVKGDFNTHSNQEFKGGDKLNSASEWDSKFYTRTAANRDPNFACRPGDPRLPNCSTGETWRPASVIADAVTLLSDNFRTGFRNEGDYDLRNNQGNTVTANRLQNGFWDNSFVTSANVDNTKYTVTPTTPVVGSLPDARNSSYLNNFVTPIQRRAQYPAQFPEYVMEMCFKIPVSGCGTGDWYIGYDGDANGKLEALSEVNAKYSDLPPGALVARLGAGTTARPALAGFERFARRVAFRRTGSNLDFSVGNTPIPLGINNSSQVAEFPYPSVPRPASNALWFATTNTTTATGQLIPAPLGTSVSYNNTNPLFYTFRTGATATDQPLLEPVMQLGVTTENPSGATNYSDLANSSSKVKNTMWLSRAAATTFNLVIAAGDTPSRVGNTTNQTYEINGGLHNFVRFLENWDSVDSNISGSFIQFKRSIYATAPFQVVVRPSPGTAPPHGTVFPGRRADLGNRQPYNTDSTTRGEAPFYMAPTRNWGFDVALLAQNPDLFAQRFVIPTTDEPNEYYREVGRDDPWVKTLLCAVQSSAKTDGFEPALSSVYGSNLNYALPATERPATCPINPS